MYSFLIQSTPAVIQARILPEGTYDWFTYKGNKPVPLNFRGKEVLVEKGMKFGVRPSSNGKNIRLIFKDDPNRVFTISQEQANKLAKKV
jgi:hypothetical protein